MRQELGKPAPSICDDCFSPLEVFYDYDAVRAQALPASGLPRARPTCGATRDLLPLPANYQPTVPAGFTPLLEAPRLAQKLGAKHLYIKNDAVCMPTLSFKDRVVAVALAQARSFGFDTVSCSSTGNLANAVAAQAARNGFKAVDLHSRRSRARKDSRHPGFRREGGAHLRKLRPGQPPVLADRRRASLGIRQRQPASVLRGRIEDRWLRNRRTTGLAFARQRRLSRWPADR